MQTRNKTIEKNNKLKKILTTASVFAMIAGASNSAMAASLKVTTATGADAGQLHEDIS